MKVFFVNAGEVTTYDVIDGESDLKVPETCLLVGLVAAPTRGRATYLFWKKNQDDLGGLTEQRWQTKFIADVDRAEGLLDDADVLWASASLPEPEELRR